MAANRFDYSTSPDGSTYSNGQRGPYTTSSMERLGSFHEVIDVCIPSPLTSMPRSTSIPSQGEASNLCQSLISDLKVTLFDHKSPRPGELKREISSIFGISSAESLAKTISARHLPSSSVEDIKRMKINLHESSVKARNRVKAFSDAALKIEKHRHNLSRKCSQQNISSSERPMALTPGGNISKTTPQGLPTAASLEPGLLKSDERTKSALSNRRIRTTLMDARDNSIGRSSGLVDRDKDVTKFANGNSALPEEKAQVLPCADGLAKSKMKKKRSIVKSDISTSIVLARPPNGDCEPKQRGIQQKLDGKPKMNNHTFSFRSSECEENCSSSPTSNAKIPPRGPRSTSGSLSKASRNFPQNFKNSDGWEPQCISKLNSVNGAINRKRSISEQSSSPPVAQWVGQRPQKLSRGARRSNLSPLTSNHLDTPSSDTVDDSISIEGSSGFTRRLSSNTVQVKSKGEKIPSELLSESEETAVAVNKRKEKIKKSEVEENVSQTLQKVVTLASTSKKRKLAAHRDLGFGVHRQGRVVRGLMPKGSGIRALMEKADNAASLSQARTLRVGSERIESKTGRPPIKKLSEQRGRSYPRHLMNDASLDLFGKPINDHEVLLAAASAALDTRGACPSTFWKTIEPIFRFLSFQDVTFLNEQIHLINESTSVGHVAENDDHILKGDLKYVPLQSTPINRDCYGIATNGFGINEYEKDLGFIWPEEQVEPFLEQLFDGIGKQRGISICQTLLSAIIEEEEIENINIGNFEVSFFNSYGSCFELEVETKHNGLDLQTSRTMESAERGVANGLKVNAVWRCYDQLAHQKLGGNGTFLEASTLCTQFQYNQMCINDRILLELSEIGLYPDPVPDLAQSEDDLSRGINNLEKKLHEQVLKKKNILRKLEKAVVEAKVSQKRELEYIAFDRLVAIAYEKYMACKGANVSGSKNVNELSKHAVLSFVRQTLTRCQKFEDTGISCFSGPAFRDIFSSASSHCSDSECTDFNGDGEPANHYTTVPQLQNNFIDCNSSLTPKKGQRVANDNKYSDVFDSVNHLSEDSPCKEEPWSNKIKKRELLLDSVVGSSAHCSFRTPSGNGNSLVNSTKGKRSERDREGKALNKDISTRNSSARIGRPALFNLKGERKNKTKPKQKMTQLSASINDPCKSADLSGTVLTSTKPFEVVGGSTKKNDLALHSHSLRMQDKSNDCEVIDLSSLQLPELDVGDFGGNGQDIGSWLNIDEDGLQDHDFMGLEIPMDDLSEVNMMI
ncbi:uncharacterized protein LOC135584287 isoform X2 [Musa acuminata AAA Group]|uniref:uncharacterized protein LOC135584287 isoform X2 n=1 Tax=Musa acuminata AAA Group TaxID=214697 RepID=UPI0031E493B0